MTRRRRAQGAFTLVDVLLAMGLMLIGAAGILAMQVLQIGMGQRGRELSEAAALAQQQIELLQRGPLQAVEVVGPEQTVDARGCPLPPSGDPPCGADLHGVPYRRSFRVLPLGGGFARIEVAVRWDDTQGQTHRVSLSDVR